MLLLRLIPGGSRAIVLLVIAIFIAAVAVLQPDWAVDPVNSVAEQVLEAFGVGLASLGLWALVFVYLLLNRLRTLFRRWRLVLGSAALVAALQGLLSFFEADLPLVDTVSLGGSLGDSIRGDNDAFGVLWVGALWAAGLWLNVPALTNRLLRRAGRGAGKTASGSARVTRLAMRRGLSKFVGSAVREGSGALRSAREHRVARQAESLGREVGDFLRTQPDAGRDSSGASAGTDATPTRQPSQDDVPSFLQTPPASVAPKEAPAAPKPTAPVAPAAAPSPSLPRSPKVKAAVGSSDDAEPAPLPDPTASWRLPGLSLLTPPVETPRVTEEHHATARVIKEALAQHGVEVSVAEVRPGPSVTMFGLVPGWNRRLRPAGKSRFEGTGEDSTNGMVSETGNRVKVDSILAREKDLALALAAPSLRIQAPVPGESVVGVEVPNKSSTTVTIRSVMESDEYASLLDDDALPVALGLASAGEPVTLNLLKMPHLLIAGATGSGKSVCMNSIISSLITHQPPSKVRLLLVDPKRVELTPYNGIPHLVTPVVTDPDRVVRLLRGAAQEMSRRYRLLEEAGVRNIQSYNRSPRATEEMPYFVICIDELADLMMTASFEVEQSICRLAQLGRATGIHLVVATQRPSVDVVTGLIKANFPSRIAFAVASQVDSRTIIDAVGAERLLGRGDMLFLSPDAAKPRRVQGVLITEEETEALVGHWRSQPTLVVPEIPLEEFARESEMAEAVHDAQSVEFDEADSLYDRALQLAVANRQMSTSLLQRRLRIGYPRAARLMDQLEEGGVIAASAEPGKPREVLYRPDEP